jgi:hypothetical protein
MSLARLPNGEWNNPNLFRKFIGGREVAVALDEHAAENEHGIVHVSHYANSEGLVSEYPDFRVVANAQVRMFRTSWSIDEVPVKGQYPIGAAPQEGLGVMR